MRCVPCKKAVIILLCLVLSGFIPAPAYSNPEPNPERTRVEIRELEGIIKALDKTIQARTNRIAELQEEIEEITRVIVETEKELAASEERFREHNLLFAGRVRSAYIKGGISYLGILLEAESFGDLIARAVYLKRILDRDAGLMASIKAEVATMAEKRHKINTDKDKLEDRRFQAEAEHRNLVAQRKEQDALLQAAKDKLAGELASIAPKAHRKPVYAVILDNHTAARPQAGLSRASLVYEYEVEGKITRYLAFFGELPSKVGPIRSARTHSAMLALEHNAHFLYASASYDVLDTINQWDMKETDILASSDPNFYRDSSRKAPHNLFANLAALKLATPSSQMIVRPAYSNRQGSAGSTISLEYNNSTRIQYKYAPELETYQRYLNGSLHKDAAGRVITARNIILQYAPHSLDFRLRPTPNLIGTGVIEYYVQGQRFSGTWSKSSKESPTRFFHEDGQRIEFISGVTWIQIVRSR